MGRSRELVEQQSKHKRREKRKDVCATTQSNFESCTNSMTQKNNLKKYKNTNKRSWGGGSSGTGEFSA